MNDNIFELILRVANMINYGMTVEQIHDEIIADCGDESKFFLVYNAGKLMSKDN